MTDTAACQTRAALLPRVHWLASFRLAAVRPGRSSSPVCSRLPQDTGGGLEPTAPCWLPAAA